MIRQIRNSGAFSMKDCAQAFLDCGAYPSELRSRLLSDVSVRPNGYDVSASSFDDENEEEDDDDDDEVPSEDEDVKPRRRYSAYQPQPTTAQLPQAPAPSPHEVYAMSWMNKAAAFAHELKMLQLLKLQNPEMNQDPVMVNLQQAYAHLVESLNVPQLFAQIQQHPQFPEAYEVCFSFPEVDDEPNSFDPLSLSPSASRKFIRNRHWHNFNKLSNGGSNQSSHSKCFHSESLRELSNRCFAQNQILHERVQI